MSAERVLDLAECREFRQTLAARPPAFVHGTVLLLGVLVLAAAVWAGVTQATLVVRGPARVRPGDAPLASFEADSNQEVSTDVGGRVVAIAVKDGQAVRRGELLMSLDSSRVDNEIARLGREIQAGEEELSALAHMRELISAELTAAQARGRAELARALSELHRVSSRMGADTTLAELELRNAREDEARVRSLVGSGVSAEVDLAEARERVERARQALTAATHGVDAGGPEVLRRTLEEARLGHEVRLAELDQQRTARRGQIETSRKALANLELEHAQAEVRAHTAGIVTLGAIAVGDLVTAGRLPLAITQQTGLRVDAAIGAADVGMLRVGMPVRVKLDAYDYRRHGTVAGTVAYISPDTLASAGGRVSYYLVSVELGGAEAQRSAARGPLKIGMTGQVEIVTGRERLLSLFVSGIRQAISL